MFETWRDDNRLTFSHFHTSLGDLDLISRSCGCEAGETTRCIVNSYFLKFRLCLVVTYMDKIVYRMLFVVLECIVVNRE